MNQIPAAMDGHLEVIQCHQDGGLLLGASTLTGQYWYGSLWYYQNPEQAPNVEKCTAGVQLEAGLSDACFVDINRVLVGMDTGSVELWELTDDYHTFIQQYSVTEHDNIVSSVCMCQDKKNVISASHDCSVKIWDLETFASLHTYKAHSDIIHCVQSHPSHPNVFITASQDGSVCIFDTRKEKPVSRLDKSPLKSLPTCVAWQPDVEHSYGVGSDDGQFVVKDTRAAVSECVSAVAHHRGISRLQFSPDKPSLLATVSEDCTALVTDVSCRPIKNVYRSSVHQDFIRGLSWSTGGKFYTCGWDAKVVTHIVANIGSSSESEPELMKMEVNGDHPVNNAKVIEQKFMEKIPLNGQHGMYSIPEAAT